MKSLAKQYTFLIFFVIVSLTAVKGLPDEIISGPEDQLVAPGETAYFNCHARGDSVVWYINGVILHNRGHYEQRGFHFVDETLSNDEVNKTILIEAQPENNKTMLECEVHRFNHPNLVQVGTLFIAGPPLSPAFNVSVVYADNNTFIHTLYWSEPFTWLEFPITEYTINVTDTSNGTISESYSFPVDSTSNARESHFNFSLKTYGEHCYLIDMAMTASNSIGESDPSIEQTYHPIAIKQINDIKMVLTIQSSGTSEFWIRFLAPEICPLLQVGVYSIVVYDKENRVINQYGPVNYTQTSIEIWQNVLAYLSYYYCEVNVSSLGRTQNITRSFQIQFAQTPQVCETNHNVAVKDIGIGAGAMFTFCLVLVIILSLSVLALHHYKKRHRVMSSREMDTDGALSAGSVMSMRHRSASQSDHRPTNLRVQACNPIYEGVLYETTPGELFMSVPNTPSADSTSISRYTFDISPALPPPRKTSVCFEANGGPYEKPTPTTQSADSAGSEKCKSRDE